MGSAGEALGVPVESADGRSGRDGAGEGVACSDAEAVALTPLWVAAEDPEALPRPPLLLRSADSVGCALCEGRNDALPLSDGGAVTLSQ